MSDLPGTNAIEYYLKGRAIRDAREQHQKELEFKRQQLEQNWKISELKNKELADYHGALTAKMLADLKLAIKKQRIEDAKAIADGVAEYDPDNPGELRPTPKGTRGQVKAQEAGDVANAQVEPEVKKQILLNPVMVDRAVQTATGLSPVLIDRAGKIKNAELPAELFKMGEQAHLIDVENRKKEAATAQQNELNRNLRRDLAQMKGMENEADKQEYIDSFREGVRNGDVNMEQIRALPLKHRDAVLFALRKNNEIPYDSKAHEKFAEAGRLKNYIDDSEKVAKRMFGRNVAENAADGDVTTEIDRLNALGKVFAVNVQGDKSILSEREIPRLQGGAVSVNPAGVRSLINPLSPTSDINDRANATRVREMKEAYNKGLRELLGNASPAQREELQKKYRFKFYDLGDEKAKPKANGTTNGAVPKAIKPGDKEWPITNDLNLPKRFTVK